MSPTVQYSTVHVTHPYPHSTSPRTLPHPKTTQYLGPLITQSAKIHTWRNLPHQSNKPPDIEPSTHPIPSVRPQSKKPIHDSRDQKPPSSQHATLMVSICEHRVRERPDLSTSVIHHSPRRANPTALSRFRFNSIAWIEQGSLDWA